MLTEHGLILREGTIVDATLIAAPPSTKNRTRTRDPDMSSSKKGNQWHFGMKAHIGVDTAHGLVHTMQATTGKVSDYSMSETLLHGEEATAHGDRGYADKSREPDRPRGEDDVGPRWFVPFKRSKGCDTTPEQKRLIPAGRMFDSSVYGRPAGILLISRAAAPPTPRAYQSAFRPTGINRLLAALRSAVEHPFRVLKRQFGYRVVRYRGLFKNEQNLFSHFALINLHLARNLLKPP